jgi:branched-chain amino acid transport system ATP-binding protein
MLTVADLSSGYGRSNVLNKISLDVQDGAIVALLGPNGAGKTTLLKTISGLLFSRSGSIIFEGQRIDHLRAERIVRLGIIHVPQGRLLFPDLTVMENLEMGSYLKESRRNLKENLVRVQGLFPILSQRQQQLAGTLSGGEQQMLAIGRALMSQPRLLILDEPSLGLAPIVVREIFSVVQRINTEKTTIFLAEQQVRQTLEVAQQCYVLENGRIVMKGEAKRLLEDERVRRSYLGIR